MESRNRHTKVARAGGVEAEEEEGEIAEAGSGEETVMGTFQYAAACDSCLELLPNVGARL